LIGFRINLYFHIIDAKVTQYDIIPNLAGTLKSSSKINLKSPASQSTKYYIRNSIILLKMNEVMDFMVFFDY